MFAHGTAPSDPSTWYLEWPFELLVWVSVVVAGWLYVRASRRVAGWLGSRRLPFLGGLGAVAVALATPLAIYEGALFSLHMVQHLLITMVAAPLLVLGAPVTLALRTASPSSRRRLTAILGRKVVHLATNAIFAWLLFVGVFVVTHFSGLYNSALENEFLHVSEHILYLGSALLFWWPVVGLDPLGNRLGHPLRVLYLLLTMPVQAFAAVAIYSSSNVLYEHYESLQRSWGPDPLDDQRVAAVIMWVGGDGLVLLALVFTVLAWMRYDDRLAARADRRARKGLAI